MGRQLNTAWHHSGHCNASVTLAAGARQANEVSVENQIWLCKRWLRAPKGTNNRKEYHLFSSVDLKKSYLGTKIMSMSMSAFRKYSWSCNSDSSTTAVTGHGILSWNLESFPKCVIDGIRFFAISRVRIVWVINPLAYSRLIWQNTFQLEKHYQAIVWWFPKSHPTRPKHTHWHKQLQSSFKMTNKYCISPVYLQEVPTSIQRLLKSFWLNKIITIMMRWHILSLFSFLHVIQGGVSCQKEPSGAVLTDLVFSGISHEEKRLFENWTVAPVD